MWLLLAEDEPAMAEAITAFLQYHQYTVDWVDNGVDAYDQASRLAYDGLILDIMMPGMDGLTVLSRLRREGKTMPALFLTAKGELEDRIEGFEHGADDYLPKPFAMSELLVRVRAMLRRRDAYHADVVTFAGMSLDQSKCALTASGESVPQLPPEQLTDRFTRGDTARSRKTGGTGIGLSTAKSVAEMVHGSIKIDYPDSNQFQVVICMPAAG